MEVSTTATIAMEVAPAVSITMELQVGGGGNVYGPIGGAVAGHFATLDATGRLLSDSGYGPEDFALAIHGHDFGAFS
jgi:hypothetical protein